MNLTTLLDDVSAAGAGTAVTCQTSPELQEAEAIGIIESASLVGTVKIQTSDDNSTWSDAITFTNTDGYDTVHTQFTMKKYVRGNVSAYTSGNVTVKMLAV
jgi:hypothetical protein